MDRMLLVQTIGLTRNFTDYSKLKIFDLNGINHSHESFLEGFIGSLLIS